ncbi:ROK family protein [Humisphaera borealis]|uniref:ROK family protein n=1 Tax=Humisphaera borealis TaxID=2807512 RepID=A0A7M2WYP1_9BACT|nr:ROK family protein [Humisphaera borealis]QOV90523.1 ROK family protein [Humisphaera borealis]
MPHAIGLDIGGTSLKCVVVTHDGHVADRVSVALDISDPQWPAFVRSTFESRRRYAEIMDDYPDSIRVGVSAPGIARPDGLSIWWMQGRLAELETIDWRTYLGSEIAVPVLNDAQAALLGETWLGAAAGQRNVALLTLGTGVGGAAMVDGHLLKGAIGRAGHLGHISLDPGGSPDITNCPGSLENAIGNCTVAERTKGAFDSTLALAAAASRGDPAALEAWSRSIRALAAGIASIVNVLDPETVIIGGGIATADDALFLPLSSELDRFEWRPHGHRVKVVAAALGEYAGAIGAARNAMLCDK